MALPIENRQIAYYTTCALTILIAYDIFAMRAYLKILALLVPREHKVEYRNPLKELTDEELEAMIEHLKASLEAQAQSAKLIEGEAA